jgi:hypothetical protein
VTALAAEPVSGRTVLRYRGEPIRHDVRFHGAVPASPPGFRPGAIVASCEPCDWRRTLDGGHTAVDLALLAAQHAGFEEAAESP